MKLINRNIHSIYSKAQNLYGLINSLLPVNLKLSPFVLRIRITNKCNLHCDFCYLAGSLNVGESDHLSIHEWEKILEKIPKRTIIDITGGEPFLAKNFKQVLELFLDAGHKVSITTNGMSISNELINLIVDKKLYYLMISMDGTENFHNKVRGSEKSFSNIINILNQIEKRKKEWKRIYPIVCIKSTILENNSQELLELNNYIHEKKSLSSHSLNFMFQNKARGGIQLKDSFSAVDFLEGNSYSYPEESVGNISKLIKKLIPKNNVNFKPNIDVNSIDSYLKNPKKYGVKSCYRANSIQTIYYNGTLAPCDFGLALGNIRDVNYDLRKTWNLKTFTTFIEKFNGRGKFHPGCESCCLAKQEFKNE